MDIHKPKPWHGWREFLKEYVIIVVGVLTALAFETVVEEIRWAQRTRQTEDHLREKVHDLTVNVAGRQALQPCIDEMLDKLESALETSSDDWRPPFLITGQRKGVVAAPRGEWAAEDWNAAVADGTINHLPKQTLLRYTEFFEVAARMKGFNDEERNDVAELNSLASIRRLDPASRAQYLRLLYRVRGNDQVMGVQGQLLMNIAKEMGVKRGTASDYTPAAMGFYREVCRQFRAGKAETAVLKISGAVKP